MSTLGEQQPKKVAKGFEDISHYFLSAAEADFPRDATRTAGHLSRSSDAQPSDNKPASSHRARQAERRKENCASCAHLIARAGQPFRCRIFSEKHAEFKVERREKITLNEGNTCPFFVRVTSKQIEQILREHCSPLTPAEVREFSHTVEEQATHTKTVTFSARAGQSAEEILREELVRYLFDGYSVMDVTLTLQEESSECNRSCASSHTIRLRAKQEEK
jgi:hypothetical protein